MREIIAEHILGVIVLFARFAPMMEASEAVDALQPIKYSTMFPFTAPLVFFFCAAQAPELFGRDQLTGVLPLYFSRAITRADYALARMLGLFVALLVLSLSPQAILLIGRVLVADDLGSGIGEELSALPAVLVSGLVIAGMVGSISAAIASLTPRRAYATVAIMAIFLIPNGFASLLVALEVHPRVAMAVLRHSRIALTMEVYSQVSSTSAREALSRLGGELAGS